MVDLLLFPSSYLSISKVDEDLQKEYGAVLSTGLFDVVLFGYYEWFNEDKLIVNREPDEEKEAVYRGWMMKPEQKAVANPKFHIEDGMSILDNIYSHCVSNEWYYPGIEEDDYLDNRFAMNSFYELCAKNVEQQNESK